jgi:SWI/SNF-related matrix-associated actin-dependent regulator of chromatin subfamily A3
MIISVVFSCWTTTLELIEASLSRSEIRCIRVDGRIPDHQRQIRLKRFQTDPEIRVLLISYANMSG